MNLKLLTRPPSPLFDFWKSNFFSCILLASWVLKMEKLIICKLAAPQLGWKHLKGRTNHRLLSEFITGWPADKSNYMWTNESAVDQPKLI
jgi:hypothetical protein